MNCNCNPGGPAWADLVCDLQRLFAAIRSHGLKSWVDDREAAEQTSPPLAPN